MGRGNDLRRCPHALPRELVHLMPALSLGVEPPHGEWSLNRVMTAAVSK